MTSSNKSLRITLLIAWVGYLMFGSWRLGREGNNPTVIGEIAGVSIVAIFYFLRIKWPKFALGFMASMICALVGFFVHIYVEQRDAREASRIVNQYVKTVELTPESARIAQELTNHKLKVGDGYECELIPGWESSKIGVASNESEGIYITACEDDDKMGLSDYLDDATKSAERRNEEDGFTRFKVQGKCVLVSDHAVIAMESFVRASTPSGDIKESCFVFDLGGTHKGAALCYGPDDGNYDKYEDEFRSILKTLHPVK